MAKPNTTSDASSGSVAEVKAPESPTLHDVSIPWVLKLVDRQLLERPAKQCQNPSILGNPKTKGSGPFFDEPPLTFLREY
jgi:hypothetical protein